MAEYLRQKGSDLPLVKSLATDPAWESHDAYESISPERRSSTLTTGPLAGARALGGFQRIFTNKETGEVITVVWFGGAVSGWPGVTHGGLVATIMDEQLGRCAIRQFPSQTGVTANLDINYRKPVLTNSYYVVKAWPQTETFTERKGWVSARLETLDGKVCADAKALYVVPKKFQTQVVGNF
jgi:acyl-coenzyme A thioesterase PaaI-like protein